MNCLDWGVLVDLGVAGFMGGMFGGVGQGVTGFRSTGLGFGSMGLGQLSITG